MAAQVRKVLAAAEQDNKDPNQVRADIPSAALPDDICNLVPAGLRRAQSVYGVLAELRAAVPRKAPVQVPVLRGFVLGRPRGHRLRRVPSVRDRQGRDWAPDFQSPEVALLVSRRMRLDCSHLRVTFPSVWCSTTVA